MRYEVRVLWNRPQWMTKYHYTGSRFHSDVASIGPNPQPTPATGPSPPTGEWKRQKLTPLSSPEPLTKDVPGINMTG